MDKLVNALWLPEDFYKRNSVKAAKETTLRKRLELESQKWRANEKTYDFDHTAAIWEKHKSKYAKLVEDIIILGESSIDGMDNAIINLKNGMNMPFIEYDRGLYGKYMNKVLRILTLYRMLKICAAPQWIIKKSINEAIKKEFNEEANS